MKEREEKEVVEENEEEEEDALTQNCIPYLELYRIPLLGSFLTWNCMFVEKNEEEEEDALTQNCIPYLELYRILLLGSFLTWNCMFVSLFLILGHTSGHARPHPRPHRATPRVTLGHTPDHIEELYELKNEHMYGSKKQTYNSNTEESKIVWVNRLLYSTIHYSTVQ